MFYRPENGHGLPRGPLSTPVMPQPIGSISTAFEPIAWFGYLKDTWAAEVRT